NALLETYLHVALRMAADATLGPGLREDTVGELFNGMRLAGYPAARHSRAFRTSYRPAYRVVATHFLEMS
ncbi:hypothetical protein JW921_09200, partial [Candidatus Fermentibacterales bacterium]|nr:hypothetical protein [Candidatus Fermentibacterales bacterium]